MQTIQYPQKGRTFDEVITQETLDRVIAQLENWTQAPGVIGALHLHACWGTASVLDHRYQGQSISGYYSIIRAYITLYNKTGNSKWRLYADRLVNNILFLQEPNGGFRHGSAEFEPTFTATRTCPIHQCRAILALLQYAAWEHGEPLLKSRLKEAIDRHFEWFQKNFWRVGAGPNAPLPFPAGWCGVTNQDLTAIAALAEYGRVYGDWSRYEQYGKPALDVFLSPSYYYKDIGLFERGDGKNFAERTPYYNVILQMLGVIYDRTGDDRIPAVIDNVTVHLFDTAYTAADGYTHLAWGAMTDETDKSRVTGWIRTPIVFNGYYEAIDAMEAYLTRHPDAEKQAILDGLKATFAAYLPWDGAVLGALGGKNPILSIVSNPDRDFFILFLINRLGDALKDPRPVDLPCIHRHYRGFTWKQHGKWWAIEKDGERVFGGYTPFPFAVTRGADEKPVSGDFADLDQADIVEYIADY